MLIRALTMAMQGLPLTPHCSVSVHHRKCILEAAMCKNMFKPGLGHSSDLTFLNLLENKVVSLEKMKCFSKLQRLLLSSSTGIRPWWNTFKLHHYINVPSSKQVYAKTMAAVSKSSQHKSLVSCIIRKKNKTYYFYLCSTSREQLQRHCKVKQAFITLSCCFTLVFQMPILQLHCSSFFYSDIDLKV